MHQTRILIVEDEAAIRNMLTFSLEIAGFKVIEAADAQQADEAIANQLPSIILLDWMLPGLSGIHFVQRLKHQKQTSEIPIIMLTARAEEENKIRALNVGVDDYVVKPFSPRELIARIKAVLRRSLSSDEKILRIRQLHIEMDTHQVFIGEQLIPLRPLEYQLLYFFMTHPNRVYTRGQLLQQVWSDAISIDERAVDTQILRLRRALKMHDHDSIIETVRSVGYRLKME